MASLSEFRAQRRAALPDESASPCRGPMRGEAVLEVTVRVEAGANAAALCQS